MCEKILGICESSKSKEVNEYYDSRNHERKKNSFLIPVSSTIISFTRALVLEQLTKIQLLIDMIRLYKLKY